MRELLKPGESALSKSSKFLLFPRFLLLNLRLIASFLLNMEKRQDSNMRENKKMLNQASFPLDDNHPFLAFPMKTRYHFIYAIGQQDEGLFIHIY